MGGSEKFFARVKAQECCSPAEPGTSPAASLPPGHRALTEFCFELSLLRVSYPFLPLCRFFIHSHHLDPPIWVGGGGNGVVPAPGNLFLECFP